MPTSENRTFPDVVKQVAEARGWRSEQGAARVAEEDGSGSWRPSSGPAVTPYRDYPGDPEGMNWVEIKPDTPVDTSEDTPLNPAMKTPPRRRSTMCSTRLGSLSAGRRR